MDGSHGARRRPARAIALTGALIAASVLASAASAAPAALTPRPAATIVAPSPYEAVTGALSVGARPAAGAPLARIQVRVGRTVIGTDRSAPFAVRWDTRRIGNGARRILVLATDRRGRTTRLSRWVRVSNPRSAVVTPPAPLPAPPPAAHEVPPVPGPLLDPSIAPPPAWGAPLPGSVVARVDYETGDLSQVDGLQRVSGDRIRVVGGPAAEGSAAARFEVRRGDVWRGSSGNRSEVMIETDEREGQERWYEWSTLFPADYPSVSSGFQIVTQWHATVGGSQPMVILFASGDQIGFKTVESGRDLRPGATVTHWTAPIARGQWHTFRLRVRWSATRANGWVELWHNGSQVVARTNAATIIPGYGVYMKQGLYRHASIAPVGVVYHDGLVATSVR